MGKLKDDLIVRKKLRKKILAKSKSNQQIQEMLENDIGDNLQHLLSVLSDTIGSSILGHTPDNSSLDVEMWSTGLLRTDSTSSIAYGPSQAIREDLKHKLNENNLNDIQGSYEKLNSFMVRCMPNETGEKEEDGIKQQRERSLVRSPETGMPVNGAHDFRFAGDLSTFLTIGRAKIMVREELERILGDNIELIEYLFPFKLIPQILNTPITIMIDGKEVTLDIKGNIINEN